jgi:hypothetical protein
MSKILDEQQWQRRRAAKLQRANRPRAGLLLLQASSSGQDKASKAKNKGGRCATG